MKARAPLVAAALLHSLTMTPLARAQTSATQKAAAEALFQSGVDLMNQGRASAACTKFEGSQKLDPALGTQLRLADCYEGTGRTASAWALFQEAASSAAAQGRKDREAIAHERAASLEQRLSKLIVKPESRLRGMRIKLNGVEIPEGSWEMPLPVDPGHVTVEVSAPDHETRVETIDVGPGPITRTLKLGRLTAAPAPAAAEPTAARAEPSPVEPPPSKSNALRTVGYATSAAGVVGLAVSGVFAALAYSKNRDSLDECRREDTNACSPAGVDLREQARAHGNRATAIGIVGGVFLGAGISLLLVPSSSSRSETGLVTLKLSTRASATAGGLSLDGAF